MTKLEGVLHFNAVTFGETISEFQFHTVSGTHSGAG
jgi:hypothetical protein